MVQSSLGDWINQRIQEQEKVGVAPTNPPISSEDRYLTLPWKQSLKRSDLSTLMVTPDLLENPLARELYTCLKDWKTMKVDKVSYRYSKMPDGPEFLQKWSQVKIAEECTRAGDPLTDEG